MKMEKKITVGLCRPARVFLLIFSFWSGLEGVGQAASASPMAKKETVTRALRVKPDDRVASPGPVQIDDRKTLKKERERPTVPKLHRKKSPARYLSRNRRNQIQESPPSPDPVQPKPDLSYYGMLEEPRRHNPSRHQRKGAIPYQQAGELGYDHFQELDKNRDGVIDPLERATGRLDIDLDLANRQRE